MKFGNLYKGLLAISLLLLAGGIDTTGIRAGTNHFAFNTLQPRLLTEVLEEFGQRYQVIFSFETKLLSDIEVDFEFRENEEVNSALNRLLDQTNLRCQNIGDKYFVIHLNTRGGNRDVRKIKRKFKQIEKLEAKGKLSLQQQQDNSTNKLRTVIRSLSDLRKSLLQVSGRVTDQDGEPIPGVTIQFKADPTKGTVTDFDGYYKLEVPDESTSLVFSAVGFMTQEVTVGAQTVIDLRLQEDVKVLDEVVVVGYSSQVKKDLTGAVSTLKSEDIEDRNTVQLSEALQGTMPGVTVTRNSNAPGATSSIRIRGVTTIGDSNPLIIVDGVPMDNINDINPNDVENISVLKDAASASIYGSRAAAGVILITTKRARTGELGLQYNMEYGLERPTMNPEFVDAVRYMEMFNELSWNDAGNGADEYPTFARDLVEDYDNLNRQNPDLYPNTDWIDLMQNDFAPRQSHSLSLTAGSEKIKTLTSLVYDNIGALYDGRDYQRMTARFNSDFTISDALSVSFDVNFKRTISEQPVLDPIYRMRISAPIYAATWTDGRIASGKSGANIFAQTKYGGFNNDWYNLLGGRMAVNFEPLEGFKLSAVLAPNMGMNKGKLFRKQIPYYAADDPTVFEGFMEGASATSVSEVRNDYNRVTWQFLANYNKQFGNHGLDLMAGFESFQSFNESLSASRDQYDLHTFPYLNVGPLEFRDNGGTAWENAYNSYFGRIVYNYKGRYLLQGNVRFDASSRFHQDYRWGMFPSVSLGWVLSEESFFKDIDALSFLKFRASWGTLGNERIGNYPYQSTIAFSNALFYQGNAVVANKTAAQVEYAIEDISWETTESYDIGLDVSLWDYRLTFTADYFEKSTQDMLLALEIPDYIGFDNPSQNTGRMRTRGWETQLTWKDQVGAFNYAVSVNFSDFKSTMGDLGGTEFLGDQVKFAGSQFNEWYGYLSDGLFQTQEEVDASPVTNNSVRPGDVKYRDISGPDGVPDGMISPEYDRVLLGGSMPRYEYGGSIRLGWNGFDLAIGMQGVGRQSNRLSGIMVNPFLEAWGNVSAEYDGNYWSAYNSAAQNMGARYPRLSFNNRGNNYAMSDFWLHPGSYFRVKNVNLGYTLPKALISQIGLQNLRLFLNTIDLLTIDSYPQGWDPEASVHGYPITTSFIFGLSAKF